VKCYTLFFLPDRNTSSCPGGGVHYAHEANYVLDRH
jgi:hypothetical protein